METRRTDQFLRFALGARSPDRKNYFKSKLYTAPEDTRLNVRDHRENSNAKTAYNHHSHNSQFGDIKNEPRAKTSKVTEQSQNYGLNMNLNGVEEEGESKTALGGRREKLKD